MIRALATQSILYGGVTIASRGASVFLLLILAAFMAPSDYGALGVLLAINALIVVVVPLEVSQGLARHYPAANDEEKLVFASTAWWFTCATTLLFLALSEAAARPLCQFVLGSDGHLTAFRLSIAMMALNILLYLIQAQLRWEFRAGAYAQSSLLFSMLGLALSTGLGLSLPNALVGVILGQVTAAAAATALGLYQLAASFSRGFHGANLRLMLRYSLPLVPASLAFYASQYAGRLILTDLATLHEVGLFTFASQLAGIATLTVVGVQAAITPLIVSNHEAPETPQTLAAFFEAIAPAALLVALAIGLFAPEVVLLVGNADYMPAARLVLLLAPTVVVSGLYVFAPGFLIAKRTGMQMAVTVASGASTVAANYALIPWLGIWGAAAATFLGALIFILPWFVLSQCLYPLPIRWVRMAVAAASIAVVAGIGAALPLGFHPAAIAVKLALLAAAAAVILRLGLVPVRAGVEHLKRWGRTLRPSRFS